MRLSRNNIKMQKVNFPICMYSAVAPRMICMQLFSRKLQNLKTSQE